MKKMMKAMGILALVTWGSIAHAETWTGLGDGTSYEDAFNWDPSTNAFSGSTRDINGAFTVTRDVDVSVNRTFVQGGATLNVTAGTHSDGQSGNNIRNFVGNGSKGTVHVSGASTVYDIGHVFAIAHSSNSEGTVTLASGTLNIGRGGNSLISEYGGIFSRGHSVSIGGNLSNTDVTGLMEISGGLLKTRTGLVVGKNGTLSIVGSEASTILLGGSADDSGWFGLSADGLLKATVDAGGITKIFCEERDNDSTLFPAVELQAGSLLYLTNTTAYGGTWTLLEVEGTNIVDNGLAFAPGVDTDIWSFAIDNSGANGKLTITAQGEPAPIVPDVTLIIGNSRNQMMRYGLDYERLWFWYGSGLGEVPQWSVNDCNIDYLRTAVVAKYELEEATNSTSVGNYNLSAYTSKVIPMMTAMQKANPNIKWFASPRPLNESYPDKQWNETNVKWQPHPIWITGASTPISSDFDFDPVKGAQYLIRYLRLMKHYGFKITYLDLTNEWQGNDDDSVTSGNYGKITQADARDLVEYMKDYIANPPDPASDPTDPAGLYAANYPVLEEGDMPLTIGASSWNYYQGKIWISNLDTARRRDAIDIASSHNTDRTGTAQDFADQVHATLGADTEVWETEQHGWKSTSSENEVTSFYYYIQSIRAGFTGINGWLTIGTSSQGHSYMENNGSTVTRNVKYYIFKKLSNTSNYGYALDVDELSTDSTMAFIQDNQLTVWVNNTSIDSELVEIDFSGHVRDGSPITYTRWNESLAVEGVEGTPIYSDSTSFIVTIEGESLYCIEIDLVDPENNFPFVQAENYESGSGVSIPADYVAFASADSEIAFDLDIVKTYPHDIAFRVSSASADIAFDIYDGTTLIGSVDRMATGGADHWTTIYQTLHLDGGPMTFRIVARNGGWNLDWIQFDQQFFEIDTDLENLALGQSYRASNVHSEGYEAAMAFDGNRSSRWATSESPAWLAVDFGTPTTINAFSMYEYGNRTTAFEIQYSEDAATWYTAYVGGNPEDDVVYNFPEVTAQHIRYQSISSSGSPSIYELEFYYDYDPDPENPSVDSMTLDGDSLTLFWSGSESRTYALQSTTNLMESFSTLESGIPVHEATNANTMATLEDAAFYRIIEED